MPHLARVVAVVVVVAVAHAPSHARDAGCARHRRQHLSAMRLRVCGAQSRQMSSPRHTGVAAIASWLAARASWLVDHPDGMRDVCMMQGRARQPSISTCLTYRHIDISLSREQQYEHVRFNIMTQPTRSLRCLYGLSHLCAFRPVRLSSRYMKGMKRLGGIQSIAPHDNNPSLLSRINHATAIILYASHLRTHRFADPHHHSSSSNSNSSSSHSSSSTCKQLPSFQSLNGFLTRVVLAKRKTNALDS